MDNVLKSLAAWMVVLCFCKLCIFMFKYVFRNTKKRILRTFLCLSIVLLFLPITLYMLNYTYPFDRNIRLKLYEVVEQDKMLNVHDGQFLHEWYGVYKWRISNDDAVDSKWRLDHLGVKKEYDYTKHSFIVSYGCQIKSLKYNVWGHNGFPIIDFGTSYKWGIVEFANEIDPYKVYIYEIPRLYIDHNKSENDQNVSFELSQERCD